MFKIKIRLKVSALYLVEKNRWKSDMGCCNVFTFYYLLSNWFSCSRAMSLSDLHGALCSHLWPLSSDESAVISHHRKGSKVHGIFVNFVVCREYLCVMIWWMMMDDAFAPFDNKIFWVTTYIILKHCCLEEKKTKKIRKWSSYNL